MLHQRQQSESFRNHQSPDSYDSHQPLQSQLSTLENTSTNNNNNNDNIKNNNSSDTSEIHLNKTYTNMKDARYVNLNGITPSSYTNDNLVNRLGLSGYDETTSSLHTSRPYESAAVASFERYDPNYSPQAPSIHSYQPTAEEIHNHQKYLSEHQQQLPPHSMMKIEVDDNSGPIYPRPLYHYDPPHSTLPPGFSAINLSVSHQSTTSGLNISPHYRLARSPQPGASPNLVSPQVPSPQR
jgi:hypothetical protein